MKTSLLAIALTATALAGSAADAQSKGDWTFGLGLGYVSPKSDNGTLAGGAYKTSVGDNARPTITFEYFFADNWGVEVLGALPFKHNIALNGTKSADTLLLPPTVSVQYHFQANDKLSPFVGAGLNYTTFWDTDDSVSGDIKLEDSWGLALHLGVDYAVTDHSAIRTDVRWIDLDTKVKSDSLGDLGTAHIDPLVFGVSYIWKF
ncbi:OmpW family protein [Rhodovulum sulfidophilum]|uniref:OmpW/AlkL family protein n=1 Tax=Rhodovulum sulfidophilum TaxID=35806 RepID=UPI000950EA15|nr:OmpW family outer membrane protein [Rhodovulum sulfidophilum]MBL3565584.1 OmpW family protein [Rhodovulum sulfidophilum]MBL3575722.1 OmpW family protein [Rhodovulum sulfidophilum]MBL3584023.1 OmpW family protein [Rhodovulum sulfidophilum]MBL3595306.1 OmpW family protein [Rhodovulum sulfidophilum]MCE8431568.1 outer membrane beta-barrel protein [Rhodovulum sulfidophilum]